MQLSGIWVAPVLITSFVGCFWSIFQAVSAVLWWLGKREKQADKQRAMEMEIERIEERVSYLYHRERNRQDSAEPRP